MANFVRAANPIWYMVDLTGAALNDEYYAHFLTNTLPYIPQVVYRDPNGYTVWTGGVVQFQASGTLPNNLYFNDELVYRIEIRRGISQSDPLIWEINNFIPESNGISPETDLFVGKENQVSNPQFVNVLFNTATLSITSAGTYNIAQDWDLILEGSGTAVISQQVYASNTAVPTPPYAMRFNLNNWNSAKLRQRFYGLGALWNGGAVSMLVVAKSIIGTPSLTLTYAPQSPPGTAIPVVTGELNAAVYKTISGAVQITSSTNSNLNNVSYVDMLITLPEDGEIELSNVQMTGQNDSLPESFLVPEFDQETIERQTDHLFNYYADPLIAKRIKSYLVGWDFPLNPAQPLGPTVAAVATGANKSFYIWDQTILFQSVTSGVSVSRVAGGNLNLATTGGAGQLGIIQYLDSIEARELLNSPLSVNVYAKTDTGGSLTGTVSLWYTTDSSLPNIKASTYNSLVATLDANGKPATFNGSWLEVPRAGNLPAQFTLIGNTSTNLNDYALTGWDMAGAAASNTATFFAIVVGFQTIPINHDITFGSVSLVPGNIATRPAVQTVDEVLRECQYYYEKSYSITTIPGSVNPDSLVQANQHAAWNIGTGIWSQYASPFEIRYNTAKRATPASVLFYSPAVGTVGTVDASLYHNATPVTSNALPIANWTIVNASLKATYAVPQNGSALVNSPGSLTLADAISPIIRFHYTVDSRLGV